MVIGLLIERGSHAAVLDRADPTRLAATSPSAIVKLGKLLPGRAPRVDHLAAVAGGEGLVDREPRPGGATKDPDPVRGGIDRDPGRVPGGRVDLPSVDRLLQEPYRPVEGREVEPPGCRLDA